MGLTERDIHNLAVEIAELYQRPLVERVPVTGSPVRRTVREKQKVKRPVTQTIEIDKGPAPWVWIILFVGFGIAFAAGIVSRNLIPASIIFFVVAMVFFFALRKRVRRTVIREVTRVEEVEEFVTREVEEEPETTYEERIVPNTMRVKAVGRISLDFLVTSVRGGNILLDPYGLFEEKELTLPEPKDAPRIRNLIESLREKTSRVPFVLQGKGAKFEVDQETAFGKSVTLRGQEREIYEHYIELSQALKDVQPAKFRIQAAPPVHGLWNVIQPKPGNGHTTPILEESKRLIEKLHSDEGEALDSLVRRTLREASIRQVAMHGVRFVSLHGGIAPVCYNLGQMFHYSAFNFYCPSCNEKLQEELLKRDYSVRSNSKNAPIHYSQNTRCIYDSSKEIWRCPSCEAETAQPIPVHKMLDEILMPTYDRLMEENKNERLGIYSRIRSQELEYTNAMGTEVEQAFQRNRDAIELLLDEMQRLEAEIAGEEEAISSFENVMQDYQLQQSRALERIVSNTKSIVAQIDQDRQKAVAAIDEVFEREREEMKRVMMECSRAQRIEEQKRDEIFRYIAANTADIAESSRQVVVNTADIAESNRRIASNTTEMKQDLRRTADASEATASNTGRMTEQLEDVRHDMRRTANAGEITASHTGQMAKRQEEMLDAQKQGNAIAAAIAEKHGVKRHANWFNPFEQLAVMGANIESALTQEDDVRRARRKEEVLD